MRPKRNEMRDFERCARVVYVYFMVKTHHMLNSLGCTNLLHPECMKKMLTGNEIGPTPNNSRKCPPKCKPTKQIDREIHISHIEWDLRRHTHREIETERETYKLTQVHAFNYMWPSNWAQALDKSIFKFRMTDNFDRPQFCLCVSDSGINFTVLSLNDDGSETQYLVCGHFWNGQNEAKFTSNQNRSDEREEKNRWMNNTTTTNGNFECEWKFWNATFR